MASIGFCAKTPERVEIKPASDAIIRFDSGISISRAEGCYNTLILGSTGTGKTTSVILPAVGALIEKGHSGLIIDIKGNITEQVRVLAKNRGRINDVIELGSGVSALKIDLLNGLTISQVREFLTIVATFQFGSMTQNLDWHSKGVAIATECVQLLQYLNAKNREIQANLKNLVDILNDWTLAAKMFEYFKKSFFDKENKEQRDFVNRVTSDNFNPLVYDKKKSGNNTYNEQTTWRLTAVRNGLTEFLQHPAIIHNFAASGAAFDVSDLIYKQKKIVVLKFDGASGQVGAWLSRYFLGTYYKSVFEHGLKLGDDEYTFFAGDEFQEFCDFNPSNRYNDNSFASKAREFKNISIMGTQSISSLQSRGASHSSVLEFLNNFNNRICFYCDDPLTQDVARRYNEAIFLNEMEPGKAFVVKFDAKTRRHLQYVETTQRSHDLLKIELDDISADTEKNVEEVDEVSSLESILEALEEQDKDKEKQMETLELPKIPGRIVSRRRFNEDDYEEHELLQKIKIPENMQGTVERFPQFFKTAKNGGRVSIQIPNGWITAFESALTAFKKTGLEIDICNLSVDDRGGLCLGMSNSTNVSILDSFLETTSRLCPICGNTIKNKAKLCEKCAMEFEIFGLGK